MKQNSGTMMHVSRYICLVILAYSVITVSQAAKWSYSGDAGPLYWHELFPHACSGKYQSPIDLRPEQTIYSPDLKDFAIWYDPPKKDSKMYIKNNGHTVQVDLEGDFFVTNGGLNHVYKALQFHFHWGHKAHHGSEHLIDGESSPIEVHLVTFNNDLYTDIGEAVTEKGGLAVLGTMFEISEEDNPVLEPMVKALKHVKDPEERLRISLPLMSLRDLLPDDISRYFRYNGSLTTPGCFESVIWTVFDKKQTISRAQLNEFRALLQFRHKHRKDHSAGQSSETRHRRSLSRAQKRMERRAEDVLEELGIKGNDFEEAILKAQMMERQQREMMADMPHGTEDPIVEMGPTLDEERAAKIEKSIDEHVGDNGHDKKYQTDEDTTKETEEVVEVIDYEYTQDVIVNNFRPVQPLNGRLVYRSFMLREPVVEQEETDPGYSHSHSDQESHGHERDAAGDNKSSLAVILVLSILTLFFL